MISILARVAIDRAIRKIHHFCTVHVIATEEGKAIGVIAL